MRSEKQSWTAGKLRVAERVPRVGAQWDVAIRSEEGLPVASVYAAGFMLQYATANANRLVECWNALSETDNPAEWCDAVKRLLQEISSWEIAVSPEDRQASLRVCDAYHALLALQTPAEEKSR